MTEILNYRYLKSVISTEATTETTTTMITKQTKNMRLHPAVQASNFHLFHGGEIAEVVSLQVHRIVMQSRRMFVVPVFVSVWAPLFWGPVAHRL